MFHIGKRLRSLDSALMSNVLRSIASRITTHHLVAAKPTSTDSNSKFLKGADSYSLMTLSKNLAKKMVIEIKGLDGSMLDQKVYG